IQLLRHRRGNPETEQCWNLSSEVEAGQAGGGVLSQGKPAGCGWGVVSSRVLGGGESPLQGEGLDGSTQPGKDTHPGHVGPDEHEPTSLRAIANRAQFDPARMRVQPRNRMRKNCTSGTVR